MERRTMATNPALQSTPSSTPPFAPPRDSGYHTQSSQYITRAKQPRQKKDTKTATNTEAEGDEQPEEYEAPDWKAEAEDNLRIAYELSTHLDSNADNLKERREMVDQFMKDNPDEIDAVHAHCYDHPEDIPTHPLKQWALDMHSHQEATKTHFEYYFPKPSTEMEVRCVEEEQQKLFGNWNFGDAWGSSRRIDEIGPNDEVDDDVLVASPPVGCTWDSLRQEQKPATEISRRNFDVKNIEAPRKRQKFTIKLRGRR